jgi:hypothetical protein
LEEEEDGEVGEEGEEVDNNDDEIDLLRYVIVFFCFVLFRNLDTYDVA